MPDKTVTMLEEEYRDHKPRHEKEAKFIKNVILTPEDSSALLRFKAAKERLDLAKEEYKNAQDEFMNRTLSEQWSRSDNRL
ncbi:MAG TPA: hypothetical protein VGM30_14955 [Puia sp.]|jgi:hypothetical protein